MRLIFNHTQKSILLVFILFFIAITLVKCGGEGSISQQVDKINFDTSTGDAKTTWTWYNPKPQGNDLNDVFIKDDKVGFAVGRDGVILRTTDSGITWNIVKTNNKVQLRSVFCVNDSSICFITGVSGTIMKSVDNGITWEIVATGFTENLNSISCTDVNTCIAVGDSDTSIKTIDGGKIWIKLQTNTAYDLKQITCLAQDDICYIVGGNQSEILKSNDMGLNWVVVPTPDESAVDSIRCEDGKTCFITQNSPASVFYTIDGGDTWSKIYELSSSSEKKFSSLFCKTLNTKCVVIENKGEIYYSTENWDSWNSTKITYMEYLNSIHCNERMGVCISVGTKGAIFRSIDLGLTWVKISQISLSTLRYNDIKCFGDGSVCYLTGIPIMSKSIDGGKSWSSVLESKTRRINKIACSSSSVCIAVGYEGKIIKTTDGGVNWESLISNTVGALYSIECDSDGSVCNVGGSGEILHTENGGASWEKAPSEQSSLVIDIECIENRNTCYAAGTNDAISKSIDGGRTWFVSRPQNQGVLDMVNSISCLQDAMTCLAVSQGIVKTTDGGQTWRRIDPKIVEYFPLSLSPSIHCIDDTTTCIAIADDKDAQILKTTDFGESWNVLIPDSIFDIYSLFCFNENRCIVIGHNNFIAEFSIN